VAQLIAAAQAIGARRGLEIDCVPRLDQPAVPMDRALAAIVELFPIFSRVRMNRQWGGIVDVCPDACPIIGTTPLKGLYFNCGWGTGGFKATPGSGWVFAHTIAQDRPHELNAAFSIDRFFTGRLIDEHGAAAVAH